VENGGAAGRPPSSFYCRHDLPKTGRSQLPLDKPLRNEIANAAATPQRSPKASPAPTNSRMTGAQLPCGSLHGASSFTAAAAKPMATP